jgi:putative membrane protein
MSAGANLGTHTADAPVKGDSFMKLFSNETELNAKTRMTFALCTILALTAASVRADDYNKDKDQGGTGAAVKTQTGQTSQLSSSDEKFITEACRGGKTEVKMSKLAVDRAQNSQVKQFAQRMIDDHTKSDTELKQLASSKGVTLPDKEEHTSTTTGDTDRTQVREKTDGAHSDKDMAEFKREWQKLESATGAEFDRQYVNMSLKCHEKAVKEFEKASKSAEDSEVKAFAAKTLPTLREHLTQVRSLQSQVGSVGAPGTDASTQSGNQGNQSSGTSTSSGTGTETPQSK